MAAFMSVNYKKSLIVNDNHQALRRKRDSNPRTSYAGQQISSLPRSTTPAFLRGKNSKRMVFEKKLFIKLGLERWKVENGKNGKME